MKMAKATEADMDAAMLLNGILEDVASGSYPRETPLNKKNEEPEDFDPADQAHLRDLYERIMYCVRVRPSGISRVIWGMATILDNNILDPNLTHLELHPRFKNDDLLKAAKEALAAIHDIRKAFGTPGDYGYDHPQGKALVRLYNSTRELAKTIQEKEPKQEDPQEPKHG